MMHDKSIKEMFCLPPTSFNLNFHKMSILPRRIYAKLQSEYFFFSLMSYNLNTSERF